VALLFAVDMPPNAAQIAEESNQGLKVTDLFVKNLVKGKAHTGVGFLDHMLDQFNSHAQIGVGLTIDASEDRNALAKSNQNELMRVVGTALGQEFKKLLEQAKGTESRFCCPLDEGLVECTIKKIDQGCLSQYKLAPFGKYPRTGRAFIGRMQTASLETFWSSLAEQAGLDVSIVKLRGDNAHHIVESTFKAFSRALRNLVDGEDTASNATVLYAKETTNHKESIALVRTAQVSRKTKETSIDVELKMDGCGTAYVDTGIETVNRFWTRLATEAQMTLNIKCDGDLWIDEHHTAEDVAIAVGQVLSQALGSKAGLNRMWSSTASVGDATVEVTMDLSNRPYFEHDLRMEEYETEKVGDVSFEMFEHVLDSLVVNARLTVHIMEKSHSKDPSDLVDATAAAFGKALYFCSSIDTRRAGATASSKGTLSV